MVARDDLALLATAYEAERLRRDFFLFVQAAWSQVDPGQPYRANRYVELICRKLERVARGDCRRLLLMQPPGTAKSLIVSVMFPAWVWTWRPEWRCIGSSYAAELATRDAVRSRTLLESIWYRRLFVVDPNTGKDRWKFSDDANRRDFYTNTKTGLRMSMSVGSKAAGFRANCVIADDPLNSTDAASKAARDEAIRWWSEVMPSRVHDPARDAFVVVQQRLHEDDVAGNLLARNATAAVPYEVLCLPAEFDPDHPQRSPEDWRTVPGELLFDGLLTRAVLDDLRARLGSAAYAGQYSQRPQPAEGGAFKYGWWRFYRPRRPAGDAPRPRECDQRDAREEPARIPLQVGSVDCSFKGGEENDFVVAQVWGAVGADRYLLDQVRGKMDFPATCAALLRLAKKWPRVRRWLIEDKANGSAVISTLRGKLPGVTEVNPEGGKESRAAACAPTVEAGQTFLPEGAPWVRDFVDECAAFPKGRHDDQVDAASQALNYLSSPDALRILMLLSNI